jgi:hypothetical protein
VPLHLSQISIFIRKVGQRIHKVSYMRVTILLFLMTLASHSSAQEIGPFSQCSNSDNPTACAVEEVINQALGEMPPLSYPLTRNEEDVLAEQIQKCWKPKTKYSASIVLNIKMNNDGTVQHDSIKLVSSFEEKDKLLVKKGFDEAKKALIDCENGGYNLPLEKYEHWQEIEMSFNF